VPLYAQRQRVANDLLNAGFTFDHCWQITSLKHAAREQSCSTLVTEARGSLALPAQSK